MTKADDRATKITNGLLFTEPMSLVTPATVTIEDYDKQRIWMAAYMKERARITAELTGSNIVDAVKSEVKKPEPKKVPQFGYGGYPGMYDD